MDLAPDANPPSEATRRDLESQRWLLRYQATGEERYREQLIARYTPLLWRYAHLYARDGQAEWDDLVSAGYRGLLYALTSFDPQVGVRLITWICRNVGHYVRNEVQRGGWLFSVPNWMFEWSGRVHACRSRLEARQKRPATLTEIAECLGMSVEALTRREAEYRRYRYIGSLEEPTLACQGDTEEQQRFRGVGTPDHAGKIDLRLALTQEIAALNARQRYVLRRHFFEERSLTEIAEELRISRERVRQIQVMALKRLRTRLSADSDLDAESWGALSS